MWIQQITPEYQECDHKYVAIAYNPEKNVSMVMSNPRSHYDTLNWVRNFCGSFSILNWFKTNSNPMKFQITYVEFDFDGEDEMTAYDQDITTAEVIGTIWDADDEDDLVEEVTTATGWCIKSIDYRHVLNTH